VADLEQTDSEPPDPDDQDALTHTAEAARGGADQLMEPEPMAALPGRGRWIALTGAVAVLLMAAAAAVTLVLLHGRTSQHAPIARPSVTVRPSSSARASGAATGQNQLVIDSAAATAPDEAEIVASLNRYFDAINNHQYWVYRRLFILALRGGISPASFSAQFGTTTDLGEQLHNITVVGAGQVEALVSFISQQPAAGNSGNARCTAQSGELSLGRRGSRYLLVAPPQWYQAAGSGCP
jgi:hypothetical protein